MKALHSVAVAVSLIGLVTTACGDKDAPVDTGSCIQVDTDCLPQYEPTWDNVFAQTLQSTCGVGGSSCHSSEGAKGGLVLDDKDNAWTGLVSEGRITQSDAGCSLLIARLESEDSATLMPPGDQLWEEERCAVRQWIENGAEP